MPSLADTLNNRDMIITEQSQRKTRSTTNSLPLPVRHYSNLQTINMFVSINEINTFLTTNSNNDTIPDSPSIDFNTLYENCFLSAPPPFIRNRPCDLSKPPNSYHEAIKRPDKDVWLAAMQREVDSLEGRKAFEHTTLPTGRKAIGV